MNSLFLLFTSEILLGVALLFLIVVYVKSSSKSKPNVKDDLKKIKEQISNR